MSIKFIPIEFYNDLYQYIILLIAILILLNIVPKNKSLTNLLFVFLLIFMGMRPISKYFGDMVIYNRKFNFYASGGEIGDSKDFLWQLFMKISSHIMSNEFFFFLCTLLYVFPLYYASIKWSKKNSYILFLAFIGSFSFWAAGVNGIRSAIATSFIIGAMASQTKLIKILLLVFAVFFHASMIIPITGYILTFIITNNPKKYFLGWLISIPLSLALGGFWENFFANIGFWDKRISYLTDKSLEDAFSHTGFRWDFLVYSATAVIAGAYYILLKKYKDKTYFRIFNTYLFANAFWILVIRASFSNRFAFLSWFLMAPVIFYPLLQTRLIKNQNLILKMIIFAYIFFTFFMNVIYY